jgi:hypothetical protein
MKPLALFLALVLFAAAVSSHEVLKESVKVSGGHVKHSIWSYPVDILFINIWLVATYLIWPVGLVLNFAGFPSVYHKLYDGMIRKAFKLSNFYTFDEFLAMQE